MPLLEEALTALGDGDIDLRARLLARLAGALRDEHGRNRRDALSAEAVELARSTQNPATLAYALAARGHAIFAPDTVPELLALGSELSDVAARSGDLERVVGGHSLRLMAQLLVGDSEGAEVDLAEVIRIANELRQPAQLWDDAGAEAMLALAAGRLAAAERLMDHAWALGEPVVGHAATPIYRLQLATLHDFRGGLEHVEAEMGKLVADYPARPLFRCVLAHLHARVGRDSEAKATLDDLRGDGFATLPFDQEWLFGMSFLAETAALVGDAGSAAVLYVLLEPWGGFNAVDTAEGFRGSVSRYLGLLAATLGRQDAAVEHLEQALELNERMGAWPWLARCRQDLARVLLERGEAGDECRAAELLGQALETFRELGMAPDAARAESDLAGSA